MDTLSQDRVGESRSAGRASFWAGIGMAVLGVALCALQYSMKQLVVPWYAAILATLGVCLLIYCLSRRRSMLRFIVLGLLVVLAAFEWLFLISLSKLPSYEGPARAGQTIPAFQTTLANGRDFAENDLQSGTPSVLVFFRGRW